jgi:hypothetical protein
MKSQRKYLWGIKRDQKHTTSSILKPDDLNMQPVNSIQFISLSIDPLQGVNNKDVENSHRVHQNIQSSSIQLNTVCQWIYIFIQKGTFINELAGVPCVARDYQSRNLMYGVIF